MDLVEQLFAREEIKEVKARDGRFIDQKRWDDWQALFTDDAELVTAGGQEVGPPAIRAMVEREMHQVPSSHQSFCPEITFVDDSTVRDMGLYVHPGRGSDDRSWSLLRQVS